MKKASVGEIQKNFASILRRIKSGEEIIITKRGKPIAKMSSIIENDNIEVPDFYNEIIEVKGKSFTKIITEQREERF